MFTKIDDTISYFDFSVISEERKATLQPIIQYIQERKDNQEPITLNFICTHNSRRSQFSQIWAIVAAAHYSIEITSYSGGVEVTAFNERAVASLERFGFEITSKGKDNPVFTVKYDNVHPTVEMFSKLFDDVSSSQAPFAALMTCDHADENCPFIPNASARLPIRFNDPKKFDDSHLEIAMYDSRSFEIGQELFYIFHSIK